MLRDGIFDYYCADVPCLDTGPEDYAGAPTSIQLVGRKQRDEELANIAMFVDRILNPSGAA